MTSMACDVAESCAPVDWRAWKRVAGKRAKMAAEYALELAAALAETGTFVAPFMTAYMSAKALALVLSSMATSVAPILLNCSFCAGDETARGKI